MSKVKLSTSNIKGAGKGIFTLNAIKSGDYIGSYKGVPYSPEEYSDAVRSGRLRGSYGFDVNSGRRPMTVDASDPEKANWTRYMNCCRNFLEENVYWKDEDGKIKFYAARNIKPGEELLFYYGDEYANRLGINYVSPLY